MPCKAAINPQASVQQVLDKAAQDATLDFASNWGCCWLVKSEVGPVRVCQRSVDSRGLDSFSMFFLVASLWSLGTKRGDFGLGNMFWEACVMLPPVDVSLLLVGPCCETVI